MTIHIGPLITDTQTDTYDFYTLNKKLVKVGHVGIKDGS